MSVGSVATGPPGHTASAVGVADPPEDGWLLHQRATNPPSSTIAGVPARPRRPYRGAMFALPYLATLLVLVTLNFVLPRAMPGDPLSALTDPAAPTYVETEEMREELAAYYGLDRPVWDQYVSYLADLSQGDLGTSIRYNRPVANLIREQLPWTLLLVGSALGVAALVGLTAGVHSGWHRGRRVDRALLTVVMGVRNFPVYFLASLALFLFSVKFGWAPLAGAQTPFAAMSAVDRALDIAHHLVLPGSVLAVRFIADNYLYMRAGIVGELGAGYLVLGRAKGLRPRRLRYRYAARNALLPVVSLMSAQFGAAVGATIFVETVFSYPGLGRLLFDSVSFRDYPTLQGCFLVLTFVVVTANLAADLLCARLDPRAGR